METYDVVILGSGAAGLTAAIAAHEHGAGVAVFVKADKLGGTSAWSGGMVWIPNNPHMREANIEDSTEEAMQYLESLSLGMIDPELARAFVDTGPNIDVSRYDYANLPCWIVVDQQFIDKYGFVGYRGDVPKWLITAPTTGLAEKLDIPPKALAETIQRFSAIAADGDDPDFGRGRSAHDTWWGDPGLTGRVDATLGSVDTPPFYAVEVHSGVLGTNGGPRTDVNGQVLDLDGRALTGLYAPGNVMASVMGMSYGGAGGTLAPAMVFGYLGGRHAAPASLAATQATTTA